MEQNRILKKKKMYIWYIPKTCLNVCRLLQPGRVLPANFSNFSNTSEFLTLAWKFEPGSALIVHYTNKNVWIATFSYIIYVTSVIHTFCHFQLFRPDLYSTIQQSGFHVLAEEIFICAIYRVNIRLHKKRRCFAASCCYKVRIVDSTLKVKLLANSKFKSSIF